MTGTDQKNSTPVARGDSRPVRYEVVDRRGVTRGSFGTALQAAAFAALVWSDQEQDEDRTGKGWDIQVEGCE